MKRTLMTLVPALLLSFGSAAFAADAAAKPDCSAQQKAVDDANAAAKDRSQARSVILLRQEGEGQDRLREAPEGQSQG